MSVNAIASAHAATRTKMRVLLVGAFPDQFERMKREFPDLELSGVINRKRSGQTDNRGTFVDAEKILVMTKFASHSVLNQLDKAKVTYCNGGWTEARKYLETWSIYSRALKPAPLKAIRIETPPNAVVDYSSFRTCQTGDVLEFIRPEGVPAHVFAHNVYEARRFYEANGGVISTAEIKGGKARVFIVDRARPVLHDAEAALSETRAPDLSLAFADQRALERLFRDVYKLSFQAAPLASESHHATVANVAVDGWLEMFKTTGA